MLREIAGRLLRPIRTEVRPRLWPHVGEPMSEAGQALVLVPSAAPEVWPGEDDPEWPPAANDDAEPEASPPAAVSPLLPIPLNFAQAVALEHALIRPEHYPGAELIARPDRLRPRRHLSHDAAAAQFAHWLREHDFTHWLRLDELLGLYDWWCHETWIVPATTQCLLEAFRTLSGVVSERIREKDASGRLLKTVDGKHVRHTCYRVSALEDVRVAGGGQRAAGSRGAQLELRLAA